MIWNVIFKVYRLILGFTEWYLVQWCSGYHHLHNFIQLSQNSGSAQVQILLAACRRCVMVRISGNGPDWKHVHSCKVIISCNVIIWKLISTENYVFDLLILCNEIIHIVILCTQCQLLSAFGLSVICWTVKRVWKPVCSIKRKCYFSKNNFRGLLGKRSETTSCMY